MDTIDKINALLAKRGWTGADLTRAIGKSNGVYSQWNTRKTKPSNKSLPIIAKVLGVDVSELLPDNHPFASDPLSSVYAEDIADRVTKRMQETAYESNDDIVKFALFGDTDVDDAVYEEVKRFAKFAREQSKNRGDQE